MKGHIIIPMLSVVLVAPLQAQESDATPEPVAALQRAVDTIETADSTYAEREAEVLGESPSAPVDNPVQENTGMEPALPAEPSVTGMVTLPDEPEFEMPEEEVFLDMPGGDEAASAIASDAETISVDFPEEDVSDIIRSVAELYELNVVIPDTLAGSVSIKLRDVSWQQVFNVVLEPLGYTYVTEGNIIKIKSLEELAAEPVDTRVFIVDFAKASEIKSSVEPMVDPAKGGKIQVDDRSNALVITERPSRMNDIQEIIETLDRPTEQVMIESKFVEVTDEIDDSLGIDWQSLAGYNVRAGPFQRAYKGNNELNSAEGAVSAPAQSDSSSDSFSINNVNGQTTTSLGQSTLSNTIRELIDSESRIDTAVFSADAFQAVLSALKQNTAIELVSNPTVVTMNNTNAEIHIGEEFPIPSYTYNDERGTFEVSDFEWKSIGINLKVMPQINSAGFINLSIKPEISSRSGEVVFGGASGAVIPIITTRKTESRVTIKSGYTLAIGGLIERRDENRDSKVPLLGDVPVVGRLFSSTSKLTDQRNLIVFITAKILSASGATYEDVFSPRTLYQMGVTPSDVPGFEPPADEIELYENVLNSRDAVEKRKTELELREEMQLLDSALKTKENLLEDQKKDPQNRQERARKNYQN